ncbi:protein-tyrosine phosphatase family protein [Vibrio sp. SCSIO 43136]|uniref:protein-tyrosine phosphatase family protein n=1 Tax=Vibrio sp. SCSIO 43136 TaxID=2819101 RepID=UPI002074F417|nr:protein-tyrosine phosphatase family protein [Vibrio sp. SCSIO 43136]USD64067.1 tyrosine protein phosphatase [Vibrio sp. SCSIO 43136]
MQDDIPSTAQLLMGIKGAARRIPFNPKRDRFNLTFSLNTSVRQDLNANYIMVDGKNVAIATQYPFPHQIEAQLQLIVDNRTPVLVVLASYQDMDRGQLPEYFSQSASYGGITTHSELLDVVDLGESIEAKIYQLNIVGYQATVSVPVVHVHNWPDHHTIPAAVTMNLVTLIDSIVEEKKEFYFQRGSRAVTDPDKLLPVIHCRAGVGRTGQTIAAMVMRRSPSLSLSSITRDLRVSRNDYMIQTQVQMETLVELERKVRNS